MRQMKHYLMVCLMLIAANHAFAQNGVIDKVVAVVGGEMIMLSDIEQEMTMARFRGVVSDANLRCEVLESLLLQKMLIAQAKVDSLTLNHEMVESNINERIRMFIMELGSEKAVEQYFRKPMFKLREDLRVIFQEQGLAQQMRGELVRSVKVTPVDVEKYYKKLPKDSLPKIPEQYSIRQIVLTPPEGSTKFEVRERLLALRERIVKGEKFANLAILYSEHETARRGGELGLAPLEGYAKNFREAILALKPGQVSPIVETEFGFHIIQLIEKQGNDMANVRHILMKPKYSSEDRIKALHKLDSIAGLVRADSMSFAEAALRFSQDKDTRLNGGLVVNSYNLSSRFEKDQLSPADYFALKNMKEGDISESFESLSKMGQVQYKILKLDAYLPLHDANLSEDYNLIQNMALNEQQSKVFSGWVKKKQASIFIRIDPEYTNCEFQYPGWIK